MSRVGNAGFTEQPSAVLVGPQCTRVNIKVHKVLKAIRVDFQPGVMYRMLGIPMHELLDGGFDATAFFDNKIGSIMEELRNIPDLEQGKNTVAKFLVNKIRKSKSILPFDSAIRVLRKHDGNMSGEQAA